MLGYLSLGFSAPRPKFTTCRCIASEFGGIFLNPTQTPKFKHSIAQKAGRLGNRNEYIFSICDRCLGCLFSKLLCLKFACRQGVKHKSIGVIRRQQIRIKLFKVCVSDSKVSQSACHKEMPAGNEGLRLHKHREGSRQSQIRVKMCRRLAEPRFDVDIASLP